MRFLAGILLSVLLATGAAADADAKANKLFVEAVQLWKQLETLEGDNLQSIEEKLQLLQQVDANLDSIVTDYPSSNLAVQLMIGSVGPLEVERVKALVVEVDRKIVELEASISCYSGPYPCVLSEALGTARSIEDALNHSLALSAVAEAQAASGDVIGALETVRNIESAYSRSGALSAVAKAQAASGDVSGSLGVLSEALEAARSIDEASLRSGALFAVAKAQAASGDVIGALETARSIEDAYSRSFALAEILKSLPKD